MCYICTQKTERTQIAYLFFGKGKQKSEQKQYHIFDT